jgi:retron-type reverse transcriptase
MLEGDICNYFDDIKHEKLIGILRTRIKDEKFISLILSGMKSGVILPSGIKLKEEGVPQGCPSSPILSNIYLDVFDKYMESYILKFNKGYQRNIFNARSTLKKLNSDKYKKVLKHLPYRHPG